MNSTEVSAACERYVVPRLGFFVETGYARDQVSVAGGI
jgi:hypothetical protein